MNELIDLLLTKLLSLDYSGLTFNGFSDCETELFLGVFVFLDDVVGFAGNISTHNRIRSVSDLFLFAEILVDFKHVLLQVINQIISLHDYLVDLGHDFSN